MDFYFQLQLRRLRRWFDEMGIPIIIGLIIIAIIFLVSSLYLFDRLAFAEWIYVFISFYFLFEFSRSARTTILRSVFELHFFLSLRILENVLLALPFCFFLIYQGKFLLSFVTLGIAILLIFINAKSSSSFSILTPFKKIPFEPIVGFRKNCLFIGFVYFLTIQSIIVGNANLGLVSMGIIFFCVMAFYLKPEKITFVWINNRSVRNFLFQKYLHAVFSASLLVLPIFVALSIVFSDRIIYSLSILVLGYIFLACVILAKYSAYPREINLPQGIILALIIWFPPAIIIAIPIFYKHAYKNLKQILE